MFVSQIFDECAEILGTTDKPKVFRKISQAVQTLMESGHWMQSTAEVDVCTGWDGCSIALPRGVSVPLAVNVDGSPTYFRNRLFQYHVNKGGMFNPVEWAWDDRGYVATLMEIIQPSELVAIAESSNDVGKVIRVVGTNDTNRPIRSQLADGTGVDGLLIPINSPSDFAFGTISPSGANVATREVSITPIQSFKSATPHQLNSGEGMSITPTIINGLMPIALSSGQTYYIGVIDALTIKIFNDSLNAQSGDYPISLQSIVGVGPLEFLDERASRVVTALKFVDNTGTPITPTIGIDTANPIFFPPGQQLPAPLKTETTYFGNLLDSTNLQIFETEENAQNNYGEVYTTGSISPINVDIRKEIAPETKLIFSVPHLFVDGDQVQAFTSGGVLPRPLIANKNYFVNVIDSTTITLHENQADAYASTTTFFVNPIVLITPGSGVVSLVKLIPATATVGTSNQITASGLSIPIPSGVGAQFNAVPVGVVTSVRVSASGSGYTNEPDVTFSAPVGVPVGQQSRTAKGYAIRNAGNNTISEVIITDSGIGYSAPPSVTIDPPTTTNFTVTGITTNPSTLIATVTTAVAHGFANGNQILISGASPTDYNGTKTISNVSTNTFTYSVSSALANASGDITAAKVVAGNRATASASITTSFISRFTQVSGGSGYTEAPQVEITGGGGTGATAKANVSGGQVTSIDIITQGSGYTSAPAVVISPSTGVFVEFQSTGTLPLPLEAGAAYRAENPTSTTFTIKGTDYSDVDIKSAGSGTLYVVLSRSFGVAFTGNWRGDYSSLGPTQGFYFGTDFLLPTTSPSIDNGVTQFWLRKDTDESGRVYTSQVNAQNGYNETTANIISLSGTTTITAVCSGDHNFITGQTVLISGATPDGYNGLYQIQVTNLTTFTYVIPASLGAVTGTIVATLQTGKVVTTAFGTGQTYFGIRFSVTPSVYDNLIEPDNIQFIADDEIVNFTSSDTLPSPLVAGTNYTVKLFGNRVKVYQGGTLVPITTPGTGRLTLDIRREMTVQPSTSIYAPACLYETGDKISVRAAENDVLPNGLVAGTTYYVRKINADEFELYNTLANAQSLSSTTGRVEYLTSGNKTASTFFVDNIQGPVLVKTVSHIEKPKTDGYVSLYAFDYGRSNDMTLIGQYHPDEINPSYRRIRIGKRCAWARIAYRLTPPTVTSMQDYIPLEHERAIITAVHACDLEDKDFAEQATRYWGVAFNYLKNQQEHLDGHAFQPPQIQNLVYADGEEPVMF
jgi:hypothetical protein